MRGDAELLGTRENIIFMGEIIVHDENDWGKSSVVHSSSDDFSNDADIVYASIKRK